MGEPCILAIDLGTSGPKAVVVGESGAILGEAVRSVDTIFTPDGGTEHDPEAVWRAVCEASGEAVAKAGGEVRAVICDSHYSSIVPVDADGKALMNIVVWMDQRASLGRLNKFPNFRPDSAWRQLQWLRIHGIPPLETGADNISHIRWIRHARPEVYEKTAAFLEPMDYIALRMTGCATANQCSSFMVQLVDNRKLGNAAYDGTLLRYADIATSKLPELVPVGGEIGSITSTAAEALGISKDAVVLSGLNDTQAAALRCGAYRDHVAGIGIGTSSVMFSHVDFKKTDIRSGMFTQPSPVPNTYTLTAENGIAGKALEHFLTNLVFASDRLGDHSTADRFATLDAAASSTPPGSNGVMFMPWIGGSVAPVSDNAVRAGFMNIGLETTRDDLARSVLEGVAFGFRWLRDGAERIARNPFSKLVLYGGGAQSTVWPQILADTLQSPVEVLEPPRLASALGVAALASERLGWADFDALARSVAIRDTYDPSNENSKLYEERFEVFKDIFKRNRPVFRSLNRDAS